MIFKLLHNWITAIKTKLKYYFPPIRLKKIKIWQCSVGKAVGKQVSPALLGGMKTDTNYLK